jgi:hypothetical protein
MAAEHVIREGRRIEVETLETGIGPKRRQDHQLLGCPLEWVKRVITVVQSKEQLAVAIWLHRRRAVCKREWFDVPNNKLHEELGLCRFVKYRTLQRLEKVGAIALTRSNRRTLQVKILWRKDV